MNHDTLYVLFSAFAALVSVTMWIDYFRRIDVFEKEKIWHLVTALAVGGCAPYLSLYVYGLFEDMGFRANGKFLNDLVWSVFGIGLNEELCKLASVFVVFLLFRRWINEPIDVLIYAGVTALGFSLVENYYYFNHHGVRIITSRSFYSALEHIINTSIIVYGIYRRHLFGKGHTVLNTLVAISIAVASHGLFDFFLLDSVAGYFTAILSVIIYLIGINFWIQMLNNANNFSTFFDYDKIHHSGHIVSRLLLWYSLTLIIAFANNALVMDLKFSIITFFYSLISDGFLFFIVILRVSRFKILKQKYYVVKPQFPFYITRNGDEDFVFPFFNLPIKVRGENYREYLLTRYLMRPVQLWPVNAKKSLIRHAVDAEVTEKVILFDDVIVYRVNIKELSQPDKPAFVLKPKTSGKVQVNDLFPIAGLYEVAKQNDGGELRHLDLKNFKFLEWVYLRPDTADTDGKK